MVTSKTSNNQYSEQSSDCHSLSIAGIIVAEKGSRVGPEGKTVPKPLILIDGVPLVQRFIANFVNNGITNITCLIDKESLEVREFLESNDFNIPIKVLVKSISSPMDNLFTLAPYLKNSPFLFSNVSTVFRSDEFARYINYIRDRTTYDSVLALHNFIDEEKSLCVQVDENMRVTAFSDRKNGFEWATGGLYYFTPRIFNALEESLYLGVKSIRTFLRLLLDCNYSIYGYPFSKIIDADHVSDIRVIKQFITQEKRK